MKNGIGNESFAKLEKIHLLVACEKGFNVEWKEPFFKIVISTVSMCKPRAMWKRQLRYCNKCEIWLGDRSGGALFYKKNGKRKKKQ